MEENKFQQLHDLLDLKVGETVTLRGVTDTEVRDYMRDNEEFKGVGRQVIDSGDGIVVLKTVGRISAKRKDIKAKLLDMHPFQRIILPYRFQYVREVVGEYNSQNPQGWEFQVKPAGDHSEVFVDVFDHDLAGMDYKVLLASFLKACESCNVDFTSEESDIEFMPEGVADVQAAFVRDEKEEEE